MCVGARLGFFIELTLIGDEKWQKKTNRSIGRNGVFDNPADDTTDFAAGDKLPKGRRSGGGKPAKSSGPEKLNSAKAIRDERKRKEDHKLKNMSKQDRKRLQKGEQGKGKEVQKKGFQGKKGMSGRWYASKKRR